MLAGISGVAILALGAGACRIFTDWRRWSRDQDRLKAPWEIQPPPSVPRRDYY